jgi:hypothetical protein
MITYYHFQILQNQLLRSHLASHHSGYYDLSLKMLIFLYLKLSLQISFQIFIFNINLHLNILLSDTEIK